MENNEFLHTQIMGCGSIFHRKCSLNVPRGIWMFTFVEYVLRSLIFFWLRSPVFCPLISLKKGLKKIHHFFLFDQTWKLTKTQHVKFASQKEPFQEHMSVGAKFLDDLLHLESVVFWTSKKLPWGATVPPYLPFWTARLFLRLNPFNLKPIFTQKLTQVKLISK